MKYKFQDINFRKDSVTLINQVNVILDSYQAQGYRLTLRQTYYQMVARDLLPDSWKDPATGSKNNFRSYKKLGTLISDGRMAGLIDWGMIEDRGRETVARPHWNNPGEIVRAAASQFHIDHWSSQPWHIEIMVEKDALSGVLEPVAYRNDVSITANKGYSSSSTMYAIGRKLRNMKSIGKKICVIYLGDHDPSGIDMTRDIEERLAMFSGINDIDVRRVALNIDQVRLWNPPENPAKETDARFAAYADEFGESCWELDAVEPAQLVSLVEAVINEKRTKSIYDIYISRENAMKRELLDFADENYPEETDDDEENNDDTEDEDSE